MRHHELRPRWGALALAALLALSVSGCGDGDDDDDAGGSDTTEATTGSDSETTVGGGAYDDGGEEGTDDTATDTAGAPGAVEVSDFMFQPADIEVAVGEEVTWTNGDSTTHTVTSDDATFDHSLDGSGATASQAFDAAGEYPYHCSIHESMSGTVVVTEG